MNFICKFSNVYMYVIFMSVHNVSWGGDELHLLTINFNIIKNGSSLNNIHIVIGCKLKFKSHYFISAAIKQPIQLYNFPDYFNSLYLKSSNDYTVHTERIPFIVVSRHKHIHNWSCVEPCELYKSNKII